MFSLCSEQLMLLLWFGFATLNRTCLPSMDLNTLHLSLISYILEHILETVCFLKINQLLYFA